MPPTIHDVAQKAGVSPSTVSRVLNDRPGISEQTRERVLKAARELGYVPDMSARGLVSKRTHNIGFLTHVRHTLAPHSFYGEILAGVDREARKYGYHVLFSSDSANTTPLMLKEQRVDGLILAGCDIPRDTIVSLKNQRAPFVLVDNHFPKVNSVVIDNVGGAYEAVTHLIQLGHRHIGFVAEWLGDLSFAERLEGYKQALADHGISFNPELVAEGAARHRESGYIAAKKLFEKARPTAIFAANDMAAVEAMRALREMGLRIPEDVAVVGFDDGDIAAVAHPPLTTVRVHRETMGAQAARRLLELIEAPDAPATQIVVFTNLVIRESCGARSA